MPFATQFALSLEATSLVPLALTAANKAAGALMNLARDLQNSGSDIVVEEDLANVFGRSHIAPQFASSFKTVILEHREAIPLVEGIFLQNGPGPTVTRALKYPPYFSMVVQLSLLSWVHEKNSLAGAIKQMLEKRLEGAPAGSSVQAVPSQDGLEGVIRACEEQTAAYEWNNLLSAVASLLGMGEMGSLTPLSPVVLGGLLDMFAIVQSLPEDRLIFVNSRHGTCILCVWAHHILGLTVLVRLKDTQEIRLGIGNEHLILDCREEEGCSISLLDCNGGDILISIREDEEGLKIDATGRLPVQGIGRAILSNHLYKEDVLEENMLRIVAIALVVSKHLVKTEDGDTDPQIVRCTIDEPKIFEAARLLLDKPSLTRQAVNPYVKEFKESTESELEPLSVFKDWFLNDSFLELRSLEPPESEDKFWMVTSLNIHCVILLILAFAHVQNLNVCASLRLRHCSLSYHPLITILESWDGKSNLHVAEGTWFSALAIMISGPYEKDVPHNACLISNCGWSSFISTFSDADPIFIDVGYVSIVRGVPCRHGIRKSAIFDVPRSSTPYERRAGLEKAGHVATLRCHGRVEQKQIQCGEQNDIFLLSIRLNKHEPTSDFLEPVSEQTNSGLLWFRTGYREYHKALWLAQRSRRCEHSPQEPQSIILPRDSVTITGLAMGEELDGIKIVICLTARNRFARWLALVRTFLYGARQILLRGNDCCFACVVDQAASQPGQWFIIL